MKNKEKINNMNDTQKKILTIPNILSCFRLCLIPVFVWLYSAKGAHFWTCGILILSGLTDIVDGYIARKFHMISDIGKVLDPIADKMTQAAMMLCLVIRFPLMWIPLILLVIKELTAGIMGFWVVKKTGKVYGAQWHGKMATVFLYVMMITHVIWNEIPPVTSDILIAICVGTMLLSAILYAIRNYKASHGTKGGR